MTWILDTLISLAVCALVLAKFNGYIDRPWWQVILLAVCVAFAWGLMQGASESALEAIRKRYRRFR